MYVDMKNLKKRLENQIKVAKKLDSQFVYITRADAEKCLELAEAEDVIVDMMRERSQRNE